MRIAQKAYVLHRSKDIAICSIDAVTVADRSDSFDLLKTSCFFISFEINNLPSGKFFLPSSQKLVSTISSQIEHTGNTFYFHCSHSEFFFWLKPGPPRGGGQGGQ